MSSGCGKNLKSWGKVVQALQKAIQEQETWKAAKNCLLATPKLGIGAATQTLHPPDENGSAEPKNQQEGDTSPQLPNLDPLTEGEKQAKSFWGGLAEEARGAAKETESEEVWPTPPPYAPQDGAEHKGEGRGENSFRDNREEALKLSSAHKREAEENRGERGSGSDQEGERGASRGQRANQSVHFKRCACGVDTPPSRGRGGSGGEERPAHRGGGRSSAKRYWRSEVTSQSSSDSDSNTSGDEWLVTDLNLKEKKTEINKVKSQNIPIQIKRNREGEKSLSRTGGK